MKNNLLNMMCLDLYLSSLDKDKSDKALTLVDTPNKNNLNIISWGVNGLLEAKDLKTINFLAKKYNWKNNLKTILNTNNYESLVITDLSKKIVWVNDGFSKMTGYNKEFAINKTPSFLHGKETQDKTRKRIGAKLIKNKPFKDIIINYRKDNTPYKCELHIFPLFDDQKTTHFIALEREVV